METKDKTIMENIEMTELPEIIDNIKEDSSAPNVEDKTELDLNEIWNRVGGMTMAEGAKSAWQYIKNLKIEDMVIVVGACLGLVLTGFFIYGIFCILIPLFELAWLVANDCYAMTVGEHHALTYQFIDRDLLFYAPFCLLVAVVVGLFSERHKLLCTILYFLALLFILETWDYWHIKYTANGTLGGLCFVIMFIIVPVLSIVRFIVSVFTDNEQGNEATEDEPANTDD